MAWIVKNWNKYFENCRSRQLKRLEWVLVPNKHDGRGYAKIVAHPQCYEIFTAWVLVLQIASKMPVRGTLKDDYGDLTFEDMGYKTRFPPSLFERALPWLMENTGWLTVSEKNLSRSFTDLSSSFTNLSPRFHNLSLKGREGKGREWKGMEKKKIAPAKNEPTLKNEKKRKFWKEYLGAFSLKIEKKKGLAAPYKPTGKEIGALAKLYDQFTPEAVLACWELAWETDKPWSSWGAQNGRAIEWFCQSRTILAIMDDPGYRKKMAEMRASLAGNSINLINGLVKTKIG